VAAVVVVVLLDLGKVEEILDQEVGDKVDIPILEKVVLIEVELLEPLILAVVAVENIVQL